MKTITQPKLLDDYPCNEMALEAFAMACTKWDEKHHNYNHMVTTKDVYFDAGQDWMYTALITTDTRTGDHWQALCPRDWELVVNCMDIVKIIEMANYYMENVEKYQVNLYPKFE
jgi:hypothetical protein